MKTKIDFERARTLALESIRSWCPGADRGRTDGRGELVFRSPLRNDNTPGSFSVNMKTGLFSDFADPEAKGDVLTLYSLINNTTPGDAARAFLPSDQPSYNLEAIRTQATKRPPPPETLYAGGATHPVTKTWIYTDGTMDLLVARADTETGKIIRPFHRGQDERTWSPGKGPKPANGWPLLNLDNILQNPQSTIVITEGEKAADAVPAPYVATTWAGGSNATDGLDLSPLHGRKVVLWPDFDAPGAKAMDAIQSAIAKKVKTLYRVEPAPYWAEKTDAADLPEQERIEAIKAAKTIERPPQAFPLVSVDDMELKPPRWIVKGILEADCFACFFGASGSGKSFLTLSLAAHIAANRPFCGKDIKRSGPIIYIAGEGYSGLKRRLVAWELYNETKIPPKTLFISRAPAELGSPESMAAVAESIREIAEEHGRPALIIIDTWARSLMGDENSSADVNAAIRDLDALRREYEASAIVVHHIGKGDTKAARGSSALKGAVDAEYRIENKDGILAFSNSKMKDGDPTEPLTFGFNSVDLGIVDDDGESVFSSVVSPINVEIVNTIDTTKREGQAMDIINRAGGTIKTRQFHEEMKALGVSQKTVKRVKDRLVEDGKIQIDGPNIKARFFKLDETDTENE